MLSLYERRRVTYSHERVTELGWIIDDNDKRIFYYQNVCSLKSSKIINLPVCHRFNQFSCNLLMSVVETSNFTYKIHMLVHIKLIFLILK